MNPDTAEPRRPAPRATCRCGGSWTGTTIAHCGACHRTFSSARLHARHRRLVGPHGSCVDPATLRYAGKVAAELRDGVWRSPEMNAEAKARFRARD